MKTAQDKPKLSVPWIILIAFAFLVLFVLGVTAFCNYLSPGTLRYYLTAGRATPDYNQFTTPLDPEVVRDVCTTFQLSDNLLCQEGSTVYADQLNRAVVKVLHSEKGLTYDNVENRLGKYRYQCSHPQTQRNGTKYFTCDYDFNGDHVYKITVGYNQDGKVYQMNYTQNDPFP